MDKQQIEQRQRELAKEQEQLANALAELDKKPTWESERGGQLDLTGYGTVFGGNNENYKLRGRQFKTEAAAKRHDRYDTLVAKAKDFIIEAWNDAGMVPDWRGISQKKYCITLFANDIRLEDFWNILSFLHFPTPESRSEFREKFSDDDIKLILTMGVW